MNDTTPIPPSPLGSKLRTTGAKAPQPTGARATTSITGGVAFRALIEKLESQASALEQQTAAVSDPADLASAVDRAHSSLQDALSLSDRLLEAFLQAQQGAGGVASAPPNPAAGVNPARGAGAQGAR